ncbi:Hypothetical predicted protein, partial [Mytilus galloprovincialis]
MTGLVWDMEFGKLRVSSERIDRLVDVITPAVKELRYWLNSETQLNEQGNILHESDVYDFVAFIDASEENKVEHKLRTFLKPNVFQSHGVIIRHDISNLFVHRKKEK